MIMYRSPKLLCFPSSISFGSIHLDFLKSSDLEAGVFFGTKF